MKCDHCQQTVRVADGLHVGGFRHNNDEPNARAEWCETETGFVRVSVDGVLDSEARVYFNGGMTTTAHSTDSIYQVEVLDRDDNPVNEPAEALAIARHTFGSRLVSIEMVDGAWQLTVMASWAKLIDQDLEVKGMFDTKAAMNPVAHIVIEAP